MKRSILSLAVIVFLVSSCTKEERVSTHSSDSAVETTVDNGTEKGSDARVVTRAKKGSDNGANISSSGITGKWSLSNPPKRNMSFDLTFNSDGTFRMYSRRDVTDPNTRVKDIKGNWSQPDAKVIYLTAPGEKEVGVLEILSFDGNSLVVHAKGEPEKEIMYFTRSR